MRKLHRQHKRRFIGPGFLLGEVGHCGRVRDGKRPMPWSSGSHFEPFTTAFSTFGLHPVEILERNVEMIETISENGFDGIKSPIDCKGEVSVEDLWRSKVLLITSYEVPYCGDA